MNNQHAGLSQVLAEQRITQRRQQAAHARLVRGARPRRHRRRSWATRRWWQLARWPGVATTVTIAPLDGAAAPTGSPIDHAFCPIGQQNP